MNILIIGNGFDIAHKLPNSYIDYLNVCTIVKKARKYWVNGTSGGDDNLSKKERKIYSDFCAKLDSSLWNEFNDNINDIGVRTFYRKCNGFMVPVTVYRICWSHQE